MRRYDLFSRFDEGIRVDREGLFSAKPEKVALEIAESIAGNTIIDAMCGLGGIAIALARSGKTVIAMDLDGTRLQYARHNAKIYGVADLIQFTEADALLALSNINADGVFLDPSWGGPNYVHRESFRLADFEPNGGALVRAALKSANNVFFCGPKRLDVKELTAYGDILGVKEHVMWGRVICVTVAIRKVGSTLNGPFSTM